MFFLWAKKFWHYHTSLPFGTLTTRWLCLPPCMPHLTPSTNDQSVEYIDVMCQASALLKLEFKHIPFQELVGFSSSRMLYLISHARANLIVLATHNFISEHLHGFRHPVFELTNNLCWMTISLILLCQSPKLLFPSKSFISNLPTVTFSIIKMLVLITRQTHEEF